MRWDYGIVYKEIRKSKGLTQEEVCGNFLSRSALARIESGKITPRFDNMIFLLEQINMTFEEFKFICDFYYPSQRQSILNKLYGQNRLLGTDELKQLKIDCEQYLRTQHDVPIEQVLDIVEIFLHLRTEGITDGKAFQQTTQKIWAYLEKQDTWYESDFRLLTTILFHFKLETLREITPKILTGLQKYSTYPHIKEIQQALLTNLSTIYLYNHLLKDCEKITLLALDLAKTRKRYDNLGFAQVRLGICQGNDSLIENGLALLRLTNEHNLVSLLEKEIKAYRK